MEEMLKQVLSKLETMDEKLDRIEKKLDATFEQTAECVEFITSSKETLNRHDHGMNILNRKLFNLELDVEKIKNR